MKNNFAIFFTSLFPSIILENKIIATIVYNLSVRFNETKIKVEQNLNNDI